jgi:hypothetical protein
VVGFAAVRQVVSESAGYVKLTVRSAGALAEPVRLSVTARSGKARVNQDFLPPFQEVVNLRPGTASADVLVSLLTDSVREKVEDFRVNLRVARGTADLGTSSTLVVIRDDD